MGENVLYSSDIKKNGTVSLPNFLNQKCGLVWRQAASIYCSGEDGAAVWDGMKQVETRMKVCRPDSLPTRDRSYPLICGRSMSENDDNSTSKCFKIPKSRIWESLFSNFKTTIVTTNEARRGGGPGGGGERQAEVVQTLCPEWSTCFISRCSSPDQH